MRAPTRITARVCTRTAAAVALLATVGMGRADLNGDRQLDAVFANSGAANQVCIGDGTGAFSSCTDIADNMNLTNDVALGDLNGDGHLDAVFAVQGRNQVCLGDGAGGFSSCADTAVDNNTTNGVALGDLNGDGILDIVFARTGNNRTCLGDGTGAFEDCTDVSADGRLSSSVALGDLNGDGNLDAVFSNFGTANQVCLGDGTGGFSSCSDVSIDSNNSWDVALADLNGDKRLDAVFANRSNQRNRVCLGDGAGGFSACMDTSADEGESYGVALGDVNGDGDVDAVFGEFFPPSRVCLGDGTGSFSACSDVGVNDTSNATDVALGDLNGDGDLDVVLATTAGDPNVVQLGDGTGAFGAPINVSADTLSSRAVALEPLPPALLRTPANGFLAPTSVKSKAGKKLSVIAVLDFGDHGVDPADGATITYGTQTMVVPASPPNAKRTRWTYRSDDKSFKVTIESPADGATSKGSLKFSVKGWDDALPAFDGGGDALALGFVSGDLEALATVQLVNGKFKAGKQLIEDAGVTLDSLKGSVKAGKPTKVALKGRFATDGVVPDIAPVVSLSFGDPDALYEIDVPTEDHDVKPTKNGFQWTLPRVRGEAREGVTKLVLDYARGTVSVTIEGVDFGAFPAGTAPCIFGLGLDDVLTSVQVQLQSKNGKLTYK